MASAHPFTFGQLLKRYRTAAGLTQEALAERAGLSARGISDMERGLRRAPYHDTVNRLAQALQLADAERSQFEAAAGRQSARSLRHIPAASPEQRTASPETPSSELSAALSAQTPHGSTSTGRLSPTARPVEPPLPGGRFLSFLPPRVRTVLTPRRLRALMVGILLVGLLFPASVAGLQSRATGGTLCLATEFPSISTDPKAGAWGQSLEDAVRLAVQQHALGDGYTLVVKPYQEVPVDIEKTDSQKATQNVTTLLKDPCIVGMVGPAASVTAAAEMPLTANAGLVMISPTNTGPDLTLREYAADAGVDFDRLHPAGKKINYFRTIASDVFQGRELGAFTFRTPPLGLGVRSAFVVDDHSANEALIGGFTQQFLAVGGSIVGTASIPVDGAARIATLVPDIMAAKPDVVVYGGTTDEGGGPLTTYLAQAGYHGLFVSGDGIAQDPAFAGQVSSTAARGVFAIVSVPDPSQLQSGAAARFVQDFHARFPGVVLDGYGVNAYDAALALIAAISHLIQQGRAVTRESLLDQVQSIQVDGVAGAIAFDHNGDSAHGAFSVYTLQNGQWVWIKQLSI